MLSCVGLLGVQHGDAPKLETKALCPSSAANDAMPKDAEALSGNDFLNALSGQKIVDTLSGLNEGIP